MSPRGWVQVNPAREPAFLSFVTPVYNAAGTVAETVESILGQDLAIPFELVLVDDASEDGTDEVLRELERSHGEVVSVTKNEQNMGCGATRNQAMTRARGDVIYMVDADNVLPPATVQPQLDLMLASGHHCVSVERLNLFRDLPTQSDGTWLTAHDHGISGLTELMAYAEVSAEARSISPASHGNYLFTRELYEKTGGYPHERTGAESWIFGMKHIVRGFDFAVACGTSYHHRLVPDGLWVSEELRGTNDEQAVVALKEMVDFFPPELRGKVARLRVGDPVFRYIADGAFRSDNDLPGRVRRSGARMHRRLSFAVDGLLRRASA